MKVIILGANTLYSVFCFFKALLPKQVWSGMALIGDFWYETGIQSVYVILHKQNETQ